MSHLTGRQPYQKGVKPAVSPAIRNDARGRECALKIPGVCNHDPSTVVACHMRYFGIAGTAQKPDDLFTMDLCSACHAVEGNRAKWAEAALGWDDILMAFMFTLRNRRAAGLIKLEGE